MIAGQPATNGQGPGAGPPRPRRVGDLLLERGIVTQDQIDHALEYQRGASDKKLLGEVLLEMGYVEIEQMLEVLAESAGLPFARLTPRRADPAVAELLPAEFCRDKGVWPLFKVRDRITLACSETDSPYLADEARAVAGCDVQLCVAPPNDIAALRDAAAIGDTDFALDDVISDLDVNEMSLVDDVDSIDEDVAGDDSPIVRLVNYLIAEAVRERASDIHIEPDDCALRVRFRVDGRLVEKMTPPHRLAPAMASRIKIMSGLDISERRVPQDGRISLTLERRRVDLRVSTMPGQHGEKVVMRIADARNAVHNLDQLGFDPDMLDALRGLINQPNGVVLVTGPTGSGKSTTLYGALTEINREHVNVSTVEDPVEFNLAGVNQFQINDKAGFAFPTALRALLRQDPDVVMVGEVRDPETARIAVQAALTGHLVLSTLHTNDAVSAVTRLHNIGVESYLIAAAIRGVLAQRLVRRVCPDCSMPQALEHAVSPALAETIRRYRPDLTQAPSAQGCDKCRGLGYRGRLGLYELYVPGDDGLDAIVRGAGVQELRRVARDNAGFYRTLFEDGLDKIAKGLTTFDEVLAVAAPD
ncbi:MAG: GspE/PulE family protein [Planctomycetota bacterium]